MEFDPPIRTEAKVLLVRPNQVFDLALPNGKRVIGHLSKALKIQQPPFTVAADSLVSVELTPFDFSKARITGRAE